MIMDLVFIAVPVQIIKMTRTKKKKKDYSVSSVFQTQLSHSLLNSLYLHGTINSVTSILWYFCMSFEVLKLSFAFIFNLLFREMVRYQSNIYLTFVKITLKVLVPHTADRQQVIMKEAGNVSQYWSRHSTV